MISRRSVAYVSVACFCSMAADADSQSHRRAEGRDEMTVAMIELRS
jgi:hypothetical protein